MQIKKKADTLNDFFIEQATLKNEDDPLPQVTHLDCEINYNKLTECEVKEIIKNAHTQKHKTKNKKNNYKIVLNTQQIINSCK